MAKRKIQDLDDLSDVQPARERKQVVITKDTPDWQLTLQEWCRRYPMGCAPQHYQLILQALKDGLPVPLRAYECYPSLVERQDRTVRRSKKGRSK